MLQRINGNRWADPFGLGFNRVFNELMEEFPALGRVREGIQYPAVNVWDDEDNVFVESEVPGLAMDDIELSILGNELTIKGERKVAHTEGVSFHRRERAVGAFSRVVHLPVNVNADKVDASLDNGVLTVVLPKADEARPRKIHVATAKS